MLASLIDVETSLVRLPVSEIDFDVLSEVAAELLALSYMLAISFAEVLALSFRLVSLAPALLRLVESEVEFSSLILVILDVFTLPASLALAILL